MSNIDRYMKDLQWLRLGNKVLRAFPSSPRQHEFIALQKLRETEIDAIVEKETEAMKNTVDNALILARKHVGNGAVMESSARLCLADAVKLKDEGKYFYAKKRALKSLAYSVGIAHADYKRVAAWVAADDKLIDEGVAVVTDIEAGKY